MNDVEWYVVREMVVELFLIKKHSFTSCKAKYCYMIVTDIETYHQLKRNDLVNLKCDTCSTIYQKTKKAWYYTAYQRKTGLNFAYKTYCSDECRNKKYGITRKQYNCLECNKEFNALIKENPKFCGHSCAAIFNNKKRDGNKLVNCHECKIEFSVWKCKDQKIFRCQPCTQQRRHRIQEEKITNPKKYKIKSNKPHIKQCIYCYNEFETISTMLVYCSNACKKENQNIYYNHICKGCNKNYTSKRNDSMYCTGSCRSTNLKLSTYAHKAGGKSRSKIELYLEEILPKDFPDIIFNFNDKETIGSELDIYMPQLKIGIELNGIIHYEPIYGESTLIRVQNNDKRKMITCANVGVELIVINMGNKGFSKSQREEIYKEIHYIIERNRNRINISA